MENLLKHVNIDVQEGYRIPLSFEMANKNMFKIMYTEAPRYCILPNKLI